MNSKLSEGKRSRRRTESRVQQADNQASEFKQAGAQP